MHINMHLENVELTTNVIDLVCEKLELKLERLLRDFNEDIKIAHMRIVFGSKAHYNINFPMLLPGKHQLFASTSANSLAKPIVLLRKELITTS